MAELGFQELLGRELKMHLAEVNQGHNSGSSSPYSYIIHSVSKYRVNAYYVSVAVPSSGDTTVNKTKTHKYPCSLRLYVTALLLLFLNYNRYSFKQIGFSFSLGQKSGYRSSGG